MADKALLARVALLLLATAGMANCGSPNGPTKAYITISGTLSLSAPGKTSALFATLHLTDGSTKNVTSDSQWSTDNPAVATVSSAGVLTAVGFGTTRVTAQYGHNKALSGVETLSDVKQAQVVLPPLSNLRLSGNLSLPAVGATSQLTATGVFADGSTTDVTSVAKWVVSDPSIASVQQSGLLTANALGLTSLSVSYSGRFTGGTIVVTPPGTIATGGRVRLPGAGGSEGLGVAGYQILDTTSGLSTTTNAEGHYSMAGLISGTRLTFTKDDFEPTDRVVTDTDGEVAVQKVVRVAAGDTAQSKTAPNDVSYDVTPNGPCLNCRLIRIAISSPGTLHLSLSWDDQTVTENLWIQGQLVTGTSPGPVTVDVPVTAGELVVYAGTAKVPVFRYVTMKLATSLATPDTRR